MPFIQTVSEDAAEGRLREIYDGDRANIGYVPNYVSILSLRPEVIDTWRTFQGSIRKNLRLRTYELVTMAAANAMQCRYCLLAHGATLLKNGFEIEQLRALIADHHAAGLEPVEVAMMDFAQKIIHNANAVQREDVDHLRSFGLSESAILDITLTTTMRSFFSKTLDALGAEPDAAYAELAAQLQDVLPAARA